jgi:phosphoribosylformylglycinamidine cyclo-ligase
MEKRGLTYRDAGVDIEAGDQAVDRIKDAAKRTHGPGVMGGLGGFGALFSLKDAVGDLEDPVLVSGTDGVGTKLLIAIDEGRHDTIGQDLVAMCANDVLTVGARALFFLDYFATGKLSPEHMAEVVGGIAAACEEIGCALIGGETAELPGMYQAGHYDLAGFVVGAVERSRIIDGSGMKPGDAIIGLLSSGLHSNGYSLARRVVDSLDETTRAAPLAGKPLADVLLAPTRLYGPAILGLLDQEVAISAMAHITGGGLPGNLVRGFPAGLGAELDESAWDAPPIFDFLEKHGPIARDEMRRTFNCGLGFIVVVSAEDAAGVVDQLAEDGFPAAVVGEVKEGEGVSFVGDEA